MNGKLMIVTCAHNVVKQNRTTKEKVFAKTIELRINRQNGGEGIRIGIEKVAVPKLYNEFDSNISEYDICLLTPYFEDLDV